MPERTGRGNHKISQRESASRWIFARAHWEWRAEAAIGNHRRRRILKTNRVACSVPGNGGLSPPLPVAATPCKNPPCRALGFLLEHRLLDKPFTLRQYPTSSMKAPNQVKVLHARHSEEPGAAIPHTVIRGEDAGQPAFLP